MKIRLNYVSNSSSSSYIISYDPSAKSILKSENGIEIEYKVQDFINEMEKRYEIHSESTMIERCGSDTIYEYAEEWWDKEELKELKEFLDKNPEYHKMELQIEYSDTLMKHYLFNLYKLKLIDVYADEYAMRDDC
jgi:hypothetical protein